MLPSLFHLYSPSRWSPRALDVISMLWLSFVPWALRNLFLKPWPVLKTPDSFIQLPVCHLFLEVYERDLTLNGSQTESWSSLCLIPPVFPSQLRATTSLEWPRPLESSWTTALFCNPHPIHQQILLAPPSRNTHHRCPPCLRLHCLSPALLLLNWALLPDLSAHFILSKGPDLYI